MDGYQGPAWFQATLLPSRAAYLIKAGSRRGFRRAVQEATTRWGGMTEPIVPVRRDGEMDGWWKQVVDLAEVDAVVNVDANQAAAERASVALSLPLVDLNRIDNFGPAAWTTHPLYLPRRADLVPVVSCQGGSLWEAVAAGDLTPAHERDMYDSHFPVRRPKTADQVARASLTAATLLDHTVSGFTENYAEGGPWDTPAVVWVCVGDSYFDCLFFWNLRVLRPLGLGNVPMLLLPATGVQGWVDFDGQFAHLLSRAGEFSPDVLIGGARNDRTAIDRVAQLLHLQPSTDEPRTGHGWSPHPHAAPFTYLTDSRVDPRGWFTFSRRYGTPVDLEGHLVSGSTTLRFPSPVPLTGGHTLLDVRGSVFAGLPRRKCIANDICSNSMWHGDAIRLATWAAPEYRLDLRVPTLSAAVERVLNDSAVSHSLSDKGQLGVVLLANAEALLEPGVYETVTDLTTPRSEELRRALIKLREAGSNDVDLMELALRWGGGSQRRYRAGYDISADAKVLERLCALSWAERGFEVRCDRCGVRSFVPIRQTDDLASCPGCRAPQAYSAVSSRSGPTVCYQLDTFVDRASNQGVLPHLLAIGALQRRSPQTYLLPGVDVHFRDGGTGEFDLLGVHDGRIVAGEVKTSHEAFTPAQIATDVEKSLRLGVDLHVMAAVDSFSPSVLAEAKRAAKAAGVELVALGADDLRPR